MKMKFPDFNEWIYFSVIYGSLKWAIRKDLWKDLGEITMTIHLPWMIVGDFNIMLCVDDKQGGSKKMCILD